MVENAEANLIEANAALLAPLGHKNNGHGERVANEKQMSNKWRFGAAGAVGKPHRKP
jgi:hypothetical protein